MVIESSEDVFIPMTMEGSTCGLVTHPPTDDKLHECKNILLSDEFDWYPSNNLFEISSMEEEYRTSSNFHRYINIVGGAHGTLLSKYLCIDGNLNLSYSPPTLKKFQTNYLMDTNQIHMIG